jgi:hypothetical protein
VLIEPKWMSTALSSAQLRSPMGGTEEISQAEVKLAFDHRWRRAARGCRPVFPGDDGHDTAVERSGRPDTVGQVSGVVGGISIAMIIVGLIGKKAPTS